MVTKQEIELNLVMGLKGDVGGFSTLSSLHWSLHAQWSDRLVSCEVVLDQPYRHVSAAWIKITYLPKRPIARQCVCWKATWNLVNLRVIVECQLQMGLCEVVHKLCSLVHKCPDYWGSAVQFNWLATVNITDSKQRNGEGNTPACQAYSPANNPNWASPPKDLGLLRVFFPLLQKRFVLACYLTCWACSAAFHHCHLQLWSACTSWHRRD